MLGIHFKSCRNDDRNVMCCIFYISKRCIFYSCTTLLMTDFHEQQQYTTPFDHSETLTTLYSTWRVKNGDSKGCFKSILSPLIRVTTSNCYNLAQSRRVETTPIDSFLGSYLTPKRICLSQILWYTKVLIFCCQTPSRIYKIMRQKPAWF